MNNKELYCQNHPCPSWADEKEWAKLLDKVTLTPEGGISFEKLSMNEVKILDGFSFSAMLEQRSIHKEERAVLLKLQKLEVFSNGRKKGALSEEGKILLKLIQENPSLKNNEIARKAVDVEPELFKEMKPESLAEKISRLRNK
jgi:hypothetical protein